MVTTFGWRTRAIRRPSPTTCDSSLISPVRPAQQLERDLAVQAGIEGTVDRPEAAPADLLADQERPPARQ
jgi:hypothetical protein